jgi:hypothetical protein
LKLDESTFKNYFGENKMGMSRDSLVTIGTGYVLDGRRSIS